MDIYAQDKVNEADFDLHWEWIINQPNLEALSFALSRPWLRSDAQAERLLRAAFQKCLLIENGEVQFEPYRVDRLDKSLKAKSLIHRGSSINKIRNYLLSKGINNKYISITLDEIKENNEDQDFFSAIKICKKKKKEQ